MKKLFLFLTVLLYFFLHTVTVNAALNIVTTTEDLAAIAKEVAGKHANIIALTPGTRDPHFAEARPSMIRQVHKADILFVVGAELEVGWLPALVQSSRNSKLMPGQSGYVDLSRSVSLLGVIKGPVDRSMGDVHAGGNPHYWLDPRNAMPISQAMADALSHKDAANADSYQQNVKNFQTRLSSKLLQWQQQMSQFKSMPVVTYHTSFDYLAVAFGLDIRGQIEPKPGIAPSASHLAGLIKRIQDERIQAVLVEPYYEQRSSHMLHSKTGIGVYVIPQSVGSQPEINNYFQLFDAIVAKFQSK